MENRIFEVKVKYQKVDQTTGKLKKVNEPYIIKGVSFGEVEDEITKYLDKKITGEFLVSSESVQRITDIDITHTGEYWYKCKVQYVDVDAESGKEKKVTNYMLTQADNTKDAYTNLESYLSTMIVPFSIPNVAQTKIEEVVVYDKDTKLMVGY